MLEDARLHVIMREANKYYVRYGGIPDDKGFEILLAENGEIPTDRRASYLLLYSQLRSNSPAVSKDQFLICVDRLKQLHQRRKLYSIGEVIKEGLQKGTKEEDIYSEIVSKTYEIDQNVTNVVSARSVKDFIDERLQKYKLRKQNPDAFKGIPMGIKALDNLTSGMFPGELGMVFARSGAGKSRFMFSTAYNMFSKGFNTMYFTIEMPEDQVGRMFDSRHFKVSATSLRHGKTTDIDDQKMVQKARALQETAGDFFIVDIPQNCTAASLVPFIRKYKARKRLDAIFVDYVNIMSPSIKGPSALPERWGEIARELKSVARQENLVVFSAVQANRSSVAVKTEEVGQEHVSYADMVAWHCDFLLFLRNNGLEGEIQRELDAVVVKARDARKQTLKLGVAWDYNFVGDLEDILRMDSEQDFIVPIQK
jgi:hypothetical protein